MPTGRLLCSLIAIFWRTVRLPPAVGKQGQPAVFPDKTCLLNKVCWVILMTVFAQTVNIFKGTLFWWQNNFNSGMLTQSVTIFLNKNWGTFC